MCPIAENVKGIRFIEEYINRLQIENDFLNCFETNNVTGLYEKYVPDFKESLFNLCEPVLTNAIGLGMIGQDILKLNISAAQRRILYDLLISKTTDEIQIMIEQAVFLVCQKIGMKAKYEAVYLTRAASGLSARIYEALKHQDLSHIFLSFGNLCLCIDEKANLW